MNWVRKLPVYTDGLQERRWVRAMGLEEGIQLIRQIEGWAENVTKQERQSWHFLFTAGLITSPPPMPLTEHLSCSLQVPLKRQYLLHRLQSVTTQKTTVLTILTIRMELITQCIYNTQHLFDTSEENVLIIV